MRGLVVLRSPGEAWLLEWSTVVDSPIDWGVPVEEVLDRLKDAENATGPFWPGELTGKESERIRRALATGTSYVDTDKTGEELTLYNRAGEDETVLSREQILECYCRQRRFKPLRGFDADREPGLSAHEADRRLNGQLAIWRNDNQILGYDKPPGICLTKEPTREPT